MLLLVRRQPPESFAQLHVGRSDAANPAGGSLDAEFARRIEAEQPGLARVDSNQPVDGKKLHRRRWVDVDGDFFLRVFRVGDFFGFRQQQTMDARAIILESIRHDLADLFRLGLGNSRQRSVISLAGARGVGVAELLGNIPEIYSAFGKLEDRVLILASLYLRFDRDTIAAHPHRIRISHPNNTSPLERLPQSGD